MNEHLGVGSYDPTAYALAIDALDHTGPADPSRISPGVCTQLFMPGVNPATFATDEANFAASIAAAVAGAEQVPAEPPLRCYVTATCPPSSGTAGASAGTQSKATAKCKRKRKRGHRACKKRHRGRRPHAKP